jgi:hypothetical protein
MDQHICIGVPDGSCVPGKLNSTKPKLATFTEWMNVEPHAYTYFHV